MERSLLKDNLKEIADVLYKGDTAKGFFMMKDVLEPIQKVAVSMEEGQREEFINEALSPALAAMESADGTLLADIITYEMLERVDA